jgi:hypothetical protein
VIGASETTKSTSDRAHGIGVTSTAARMWLDAHTLRHPLENQVTSKFFGRGRFRLSIARGRNAMARTTEAARLPQGGPGGGAVRRLSAIAMEGSGERALPPGPPLRCGSRDATGRRGMRRGTKGGAAGGRAPWQWSEVGNERCLPPAAEVGLRVRLSSA